VLSPGAAVSVAEGPLALPLAASALAGVPSTWIGSSTEALAGEPPLGGVVERDGMSGVASGGSWCCCSSPARPTKTSAKEERSLAPDSGK
jgi:hypothetical protein